MRISVLPWALMAALLCGSVAAAAPVVVKIDLKPLIRSAAASKVQFAVPVAHAATASKDGQWRKVGDQAQWRYAVQVPTAVSLSFHAAKVRLPADATLMVQSAWTTVIYRGADFKRPDLWGRVQPGDSLQFTLSVAAGERAAVVFELQSLQAGYRSLGPQVADHPYYRQIMRASATTGTASCAQNYACSVSTANTPVGQATVAVVIGNLFQCTGTLLNDVPGDYTPYVLTARHCENGVLGGGAPSNASQLTVYWDAVSACGAALGSIYDPAIVTQTGATTVVEQQDAWLVKLDDNPVVKDAQFAGFDASGAPVQGGYSIHLALGLDKQLTTWFGQAYSTRQSGVLGVTYISDFLGTVNAKGNSGPGASGGGLIDAHNRLVGSLSLGTKSDDPSGYEACPVSNPSPASATYAANYFTSLAAVWNSTADTTSTTGTTTLKSVLDPAGSGTTIVSSTPAVNLNFAASATNPQDGDPIVLSWHAANASQCTASSGANGDGWTGTLPASGTVTVTEAVGGPVSYGLTCQFAGDKHITATLTVQWYGSVPTVNLETIGFRWTGAPATLTWSSNLTPCSLAGGSLALTNLPATGSVNTTQTTPGDVTYSMSCGVGVTSSTTVIISYVAPTVDFKPNGTDRLMGEPLILYWNSYADSCTPSGGAPNDAWSGNAYGGQGNWPDFSGTLGTRTYTLTCTSGPNTVTQSTTVTVENNAPYVTASATPATVTYTGTPADYLAVSWKSNLTTCAIGSTPDMLDEAPSTHSPLDYGESDAEDTETLSPKRSATYKITVSCSSSTGGTSVTSTPMTVVVSAPPAPTATVSVTPTTVTTGQQYTLTWSSSNAENCRSVGSVDNIGSAWGGNASVPPSGSEVLTTNHAGNGLLGIDCQSIDPTQGDIVGQATITVTDPPVPSDTLTASVTTATVGQSFTLTWSSANTTSCAASGGGANGTLWSGTLATSGSVTQTASTPGTFTYTLECTLGTQSVDARQDVTVNPAPVASTSSSGGGGGGGALGFAELGVLVSLVPLAARRRRSAPRIG